MNANTGPNRGEVLIYLRKRNEFHYLSNLKKTGVLFLCGFDATSMMRIFDTS
ncbi:MAG: hypothetical protein ACI9G1_004407 [Pirellulaceae bacterium]|jgi:hypothetical protein